MQKVFNNPKQAVNEFLEGYMKCHADKIEKTANRRVFIYKRDRKKQRVGVVSGGGSGHFPAFIGYLDEGFLDAVAVGDIFRAPDAEVFLDAFREADMGKGVICIHGNYQLDNENVTKAIALAEKEGIVVRRVVANDDVASMKNGNRDQSRGLAGEVLLWKIAGSAAALGYDLEQTVHVCEYAMRQTRSIGIGLSACVIPEAGVPNFDVIEGTMEFGIGHHGDPGLASYKMRSAHEMAELMLNEICNGYEYQPNSEVLVLVSGLGSTTHMELYILYNEVHEYLKEHGISVFRSYVGNYFTSLDMGGMTVSLLNMDEELKKLILYKERNNFLN